MVIRLVKIFLLATIVVWVSLHFIQIYWAEAGVIRVDKASDLNKVIDDLAPGYTLLVKEGTYRLPFWEIKDLAGEEGKPITIKAEGKVEIIGISNLFSVVEMNNVNYVNFEGFDISSSIKTLQGIDAIKISGNRSSHLNLKNLRIHDVSGRGMDISAVEAESIGLTDSEIYNCEGSGISWGYPGKGIVHDSWIKRNYIHHCPKDQTRKGYFGIQIKEESHDNIVESNVLHDTGSSNRSSIAVYYGFKIEEGESLEEANVIKGNMIFNCRGNGISAISDTIIEENMVFFAKNGFDITGYENDPYGRSGPIENLKIKSNTAFSCEDNCIYISDWSRAGKNVSLEGNVLFQDDDEKIAIKGKTGNAEVKDNIYFGISEIKEGASLAEDSSQFMKALNKMTGPTIAMSTTLELALSEALSRIETPIERPKDKVVAPKLANADEVSLAEAEEIFLKESLPSMTEAESNVYEKILNKAGCVSEKDKYRMAFFIGRGTLSTESLGVGERAGVLDSYMSAFDKIPGTASEWQDVIKIGMGRWPSERNDALEEQIKSTVFRKIYLRDPDSKNPNDNAAVTIIAYGLRPSNRNTESEKNAVKIFEKIFKSYPKSALDWNIVRAIAYSGSQR